MPKIETPEEFIRNQIIGHKHDDAVAAITAGVNAKVRTALAALKDAGAYRG